jgi:hypothetical protein
MAEEARKTSLGMQAVGVGPLEAYESVRAAPRGNGKMHVLGLVVTVALHVGVLALVAFMNEWERGRTDKLEEPPFQAIEAGLAFKKKSTAAPKSKLPQKEPPPKVKQPDAPKVASNPDVVPTPKEKKRPEEVEKAENIFDKYRQLDSKAQEEVEQEGSDDGSEYGTLEQAKGDPYVGELIGRMITDFTVPSVVSDPSLVTWGCVKLDAEGKIMDRALDPEHKSNSHAFNSAVEARLKRTTDMEQPVPNYLKAMLVGKFVCATYSSRME